MLVTEYRYFRVGKIIVAPMGRGTQHFPHNARVLLSSLSHTQEVFPDHIQSVEDVFAATNRFRALMLWGGGFVLQPLYDAVAMYRVEHARSSDVWGTVVEMSFDDLMLAYMTI